MYYIIDMPIERTKRTFEIITVFKLSKHTPKRILDIGCGHGTITNSLHEKGFNIVGLDVDENNHKGAKERFPSCDFRLYDGLNIPFEPNSFDTIIMNDVFEHIPYKHMDKLINQIKNIIEPNGLIYISVTNRYELVEPHTLIPFLTWLPRVCWHPIDIKIKKEKQYPISEVFPYTFRKVRKFCKKHNLEYTDFTFIYTLHKFADPEYIGSRTLRTLVKLLKKIRMQKLFYYLAYRFSVILFVCRVKK